MFTDIGMVIEEEIQDQVKDGLRNWMFDSLVRDLGEGDEDRGLAELAAWVQMTQGQRMP